MSLIHVTSKNFEKALQAAPGVAVVDFFAQQKNSYPELPVQ